MDNIQKLKKFFPFRFKDCLTAVFFLLLSSLYGCSFIVPQSSALAEQELKDIPVKKELTKVPFYPQNDFQCGPAALAMILNSSGVSITPDILIDQVYLPSKKGTLQVEMLAAVRRQGLLAFKLSPKLTDLLSEIAAGNPVIVLEDYGYGLGPVSHYAVAIGYDLEEKEIIRRSGTHRREIMPFIAFEYLWKTEGYWAMIAVPPNEIPETATENSYAKAILDLEESGHIKSAQIAYGTMNERWPNNLIGLMGLGNTAYALKELENAKNAFLKASQVHPESSAAFNNLATVLAELNQFDEAIIAANNAVNLGGPLLKKANQTLKNIELQMFHKK